MKHRTFALIAAMLLAITLMESRASTKDEGTLQDALTLFLCSGETLAAGGDSAEALRQRLAPCFTDAALRAFLSSEPTRRLPLALCRADATPVPGQVTLTAAENASGYVFTLPLRCERGDESRDFTLTGYAAFNEKRLAALSLDDAEALERWLAGA